jgi:hypothetical protein
MAYALIAIFVMTRFITLVRFQQPLASDTLNLETLRKADLFWCERKILRGKRARSGPFSRLGLGLQITDYG